MFVSGCERVKMQGAYFAVSECVDVYLSFVVLCFIFVLLDVIFGGRLIF